MLLILAPAAVVPTLPSDCAEEVQASMLQNDDVEPAVFVVQRRTAGPTTA